MLAQRSPYFETALTGGWREREDKAIDIELPSLEVFEDFRLLLKLSYGGTFVMDDGERVPRDVMLRLLLLSNEFEMVGALTELAGALEEGMTHEGALDVFRVVPEEIYGHDAIKSLLDHAGDTIADGLGPVHELWGIGPCKPHTVRFYSDSSLAAKAKALPLHALERTLRSPKLRIRSENEAFTLMESWLHAQECETDKEKQYAWDRLSKSMRFRRMSCDFLSSAVARSCWFLKSSRKANIFGTCLWHSEMPCALKAFPGHKLGPPDRGSMYPRQWTFRPHFTRDSLKNIEEGRSVWRGIGVANGYPVVFGIHRTDVPNLYFAIDVPVLKMDGSEYDEEDAEDTSGVIMAYAVRVEDSRFVEGWDVLCMDFRIGELKLPISSWEAFVAEGSPYFREGKCRIKVTLRFWKDVEWQKRGHSDEWYESDGEL